MIHTNLTAYLTLFKDSKQRIAYNIILSSILCLLSLQVHTATPSSHAISSWEISGAIAARTSQKSWSASLSWVQQGSSRYQIRLFGPIGSGTVLITRNGGSVHYQDGPKVLSASSADTLLKQQTGIRLPVNNLYYWIRGLPAPGTIQDAKRDGANHLLLLKQSGYIIQYLRYTAYGRMILPTQMQLTGNGVFIKLVIKRWKI